MKKDRNDPRYLRKLLRECLDFWARPDVTDMPHIDLFDEINKASNWTPKPEEEYDVQKQKVRKQ
jgi:hypothetical protein